ncbi:helix-turn-helix transcriptional regulator [Natronococcus sp. A-GB7]|uniref:helix-turn-helix transcriptional regulator n=1 Tax=Natronococcus sp. A-GB7 TaxID=3037649 RepID=UPI00241F6EE3|nr:helix-turn-helix transcriptional regulator [Natronococcus sp. A-GB7]MDG5817633.1 helix-turn-helix transcriptional regulator [Natronococcus sp. A-GB7]
MKNDLRQYREARDLSQADLAAAVGVSRQTINAIERERYDPSLERAFKLAAYLDCRVEELFDPRLNGTGQAPESFETTARTSRRR